MAQYHLNIFADLMELDPANPFVIPDPFNSYLSLSENTKIIYKGIRQALKNDNRIEAMVNAFYLGFLLEERASTPSDQRNCRRLLTEHYVQTCSRIYFLFSKVGIAQIYRTKRSKFWMFRKLKKVEYNQLLQDIDGLV